MGFIRCVFESFRLTISILDERLSKKDLCITLLLQFNCFCIHTYSKFQISFWIIFINYLVIFRKILLQFIYIYIQNLGKDD